jgi:hypothetical protein
MGTLARDTGKLWPDVWVQSSFGVGGSTWPGHSMACDLQLGENIVSQRNRIGLCVPLYSRRDHLHKSCAILFGHARY